MREKESLYLYFAKTKTSFYLFHKHEDLTDKYALLYRAIEYICFS